MDFFNTLNEPLNNNFNDLNDLISKLEGLSPVPFAVYQFVNKRVVTRFLSDGFCKVFGFDDKEEAYYVMDYDMYKDAHPDDISRIADAAFHFATEGGVYNTVYRTKLFNDKSGKYTIIHARGEHVYSKDGKRFAIVWYMDEGPYSRDTGRYENNLHEALNNALHNETFFHKNYYDFLTGLPNMTYFLELAAEGVKSMTEKKLESAFIFFDLSGMKAFNRKYGFAEGDRLIRSIAKILVKYFSNENCARFGQDHFAVYTEYKNLENTIENIFQDCREANNGRTLPVRAGIYLQKIEAVNPGTACDRAKMACDINRNSYLSVFEYFDCTMLTEATKKNYVIENLDKAINEKWIHVYYQPIVKTESGRICNEEALARWFDPIKGILSPADFIPVLEDAKLIYKIDLFMIEQVLKNMKLKEKAGVRVVPVSVNLSRSDFEACDMVSEICKLVDDAGVNRNMLNIEITESVIGRDYEYMKAQIDKFHELGFNVWMDDFGTGYSSLDLLQSFDFELIKFDMHFMKQFKKSDQKSRIILTELMNMAFRLGIDTLVEGVEVEEQAYFLRSIGCDKVQGFLYSKPVPFEKIFELYKSDNIYPVKSVNEANENAGLLALNIQS